MVFSCSITTSKGGSEATLTRTTLSVTSGLIWLLEIDFPPGCCGLAHVRILDGKYQVFPATSGESFNGDNLTLHMEDLYFKQAAPWEFIIESWNEDEKWDHTLNIRIGQAMGKAEMSRYMPALAFEDFEKLLSDMIVNQETVRQAQVALLAKELGGG